MQCSDCILAFALVLALPVAQTRQIMLRMQVMTAGEKGGPPSAHDFSFHGCLGPAARQASEVVLFSCNLLAPHVLLLTDAGSAHVAS